MNKIKRTHEEKLSAEENREFMLNQEAYAKQTRHDHLDDEQGIDDEELDLEANEEEGEGEEEGVGI